MVEAFIGLGGVLVGGLLVFLTQRDQQRFNERGRVASERRSVYEQVLVHYEVAVRAVFGWALNSVRGTLPEWERPSPELHARLQLVASPQVVGAERALTEALHQFWIAADEELPFSDAQHVLGAVFDCLDVLTDAIRSELGYGALPRPKVIAPPT